MAENIQIQAAFEAAHQFLHPILDRDELRKNPGSSLIEILRRNLSASPAGDIQARLSVIEKALQCLQNIHNALILPVGSGSGLLQDDAREDAKRRRVVYTLLDLISIEGVYPCLSSGVGIPLEKRVISSLPTGVIARQAPEVTRDNPRNEDLLHRILSTLTCILFDERGEGIQHMVRARFLSDIISATADLAFNSHDITSEERISMQQIFDKIITESPTSVLLPTLSSFLQPDAASWFKNIISSRVSKIALRDDGVIHIIWFLASQFAPALGKDVSESSPNGNGPPITVQAIMQISKLLSSVPQDMDPTPYFENIAPKLLALIDSDEPDLRRTAAYVIGSGILGKKAYGAPGTIGHSIFIEPLFKAITATVDPNSRKWLKSFNPVGQAAAHPTPQIIPKDVLVDEPTLRLALERLSTIALQHPNPGLVKRLVQPILLPLWGLTCCVQVQNGKGSWHERSWPLLQTFFALSPGFPPFLKLTDNLLWDGGATWTFREDQGSGVTIVKRSDSGVDIVRMLDTLDSRADNFSRLLACDPQSEDRTADVFLHVSERWLVNTSKQTPTAPTLLDKLNYDPSTDSNAIVAKVVSAKIAERLLSVFKDTLSRRPLKILELAQHIIESERSAVDERERRGKAHEIGRVSLESLANIARPAENETAVTDDQQNTSETLSATFSLLSTILASPEFPMTRVLLPKLDEIKSQLDQLRPSLPHALSNSAFTASMLLEIQIKSPDGTQQADEPKSSQAADLETHRQALKNITSPLPPVQAEGLSLLSKLISTSSPVLDIPSTMTLLLSIITGQSSETAANEEFIYLNAIRLIGQLASNHPHTVVKTLVDQYADRNEERTLDQRLKIGESLLRTVENLGEALTGEVMRIIGESMIAVAGRRGHRPKTQKARREQIEKGIREKERKQREKDTNLPSGWKVSSPALLNPEEEIDTLLPDDEDSDAETPEHRAISANIISAWAAGAASDVEPDDIRVRASAISILASAIQTNLPGLGPSLASSAVDLALSTMKLEKNPESAILRRASAILLLDLVKAMDLNMQSGSSKNLGFGFSLIADSSSGNDDSVSSRGPATIGSIPTILNTLSYVDSQETDALVRGHIRVLIENLQTWMEKSLLWGINAQSSMSSGDDQRMHLGDRIAGLDINPLATRGSTDRPRIEEIE